MKSNTSVRMGQRWGVCFALVALAGGGACNGEHARPAPVSSEGNVGTVHLALTSQNGDTFRLRRATFEISNASDVEVATLRSDSDAGDEALQAELPQGQYQVLLAADWVLEKQGADGAFEPVQSALLTGNPRPFSVRNQRVTELAFAFTTNDGIVTLGAGALNIALEVNDIAALPECSLIDPNTCPEGQTCLLGDRDGRTFCAQPGTLEVGSSCESEQCVAGAQCLRSGEDAGSASVCHRFCAPNAQSPFCDCRSLDFDENVGVCALPADCEPNCGAAETFTFVDTTQDDVASTALLDFFSGLGEVSPDWYIRVERVNDGGSEDSWCAERADFYVSSYLNYATSSGVLASSDWNKYWRVAGGEWQGPTTQAFNNYYGWSCNSGPYDWCGEWGLGSLNLGVLPGSTWSELYPQNIGATLTVAVGRSRQTTCGF
jgi:hypothetical protein